MKIKWKTSLLGRANLRTFTPSALYKKFVAINKKIT